MSATYKKDGVYYYIETGYGFDVIHSEVVHENDKFGVSSAEEAIHLYPDFEFIEDSLDGEELPF